MDIQRIEGALKVARRHGGADGEFEALQDIVNALLFRDRVASGDLNLEFYDWYLDRLIKLHEEIQTRINTLSPPYQIRLHGNAILGRIRAILDIIGER